MHTSQIPTVDLGSPVREFLYDVQRVPGSAARYRVVESPTSANFDCDVEEVEVGTGSRDDMLLLAQRLRAYDEFVGRVVDYVHNCKH